MINKVKGIFLVIFGLLLIIFVYNFDRIMHRKTEFGTKAVLGIAAGTISVINGIRIYRRD
jgi:hypothetical protein